MRPLSLMCSLAALTLLFAGCVSDGQEKPAPVNQGGTATGGTATGGTAAVDPAADATADAGEPRADIEQAQELAAKDDVFRASLEKLAAAAEQEIALAAAAREAEAAALEKLGGVLAEEIAAREQQELEMAKHIISTLQERGFNVQADIVDLPLPLPEAAANILGGMEVGQTSQVLEIGEGYGIVRLIAKHEDKVKVGYIYATKEEATKAGG